MSQIQVYRSSRLRTLLAIPFFAGFAALGVLMQVDKPLVGWALALLFGGLALASVVTLATGGVTLTLGRKGFEIASWLRRRRVRWDEIEPVRVGQFRNAKVVGVSYLAGHPASGMSRAMTGMDLSLGNQFGVPPQQVCDAMNDFRERFLRANPAARAAILARDGTPAGMSPRAPAVGLRPAREVLVAFVAAVLVGVLNIILRLVLKLEGVFISFGIAFAAGAMALAWFLKVLRRAPTPRERMTFLCVYSGLVVLPFAALYVSVAASRGFPLPGMLIFLLHAIAYPAVAQRMLRAPRFSALPAARA